jgi:hypothetical protein
VTESGIEICACSVGRQVRNILRKITRGRCAFDPYLGIMIQPFFVHDVELLKENTNMNNTLVSNDTKVVPARAVTQPCGCESLKLIQEHTHPLVRAVRPVPIQDWRYAIAKEVWRMSRRLMEVK